MISERQLAESFDSFWQNQFPLLNPTFVRQFNADKMRLEDRRGRSILPIPMGKTVERFDLVAELAFELAQDYYANLGGIGSNREAAIGRALTRIKLIIKADNISNPTTAELEEADALKLIYEEFFGAIPKSDKLIFRPRIKGAGILNVMEADFCSESTLYEVKAVNRNLQSGDIRQVVCYLFSAMASRQYNWTDYCIFNPRLAVAYSGKIEQLIAYLSGRSPHECVSDVLDALVEREQPLDTRF